MAERTIKPGSSEWAAFTASPFFADKPNVSEIRLAPGGNIAGYSTYGPKYNNVFGRGASRLGSILGHVVPGMEQAMSPRANLLQQLWPALVGGLEAGTAAAGGGALFNLLRGAGAAGAGLGSLGAAAAPEAAIGGLNAGGVTAALPIGESALGAALTEAPAAAAAAKGLMRWAPVAKALAGGGKIAAGARFAARHPLALAGAGAYLYGKLAGGPEAAADVAAEDIAAAVGIDAKEAETRMKKFRGLTTLGYDGPSAVAEVFPELAAQQAQAPAQEQLQMQYMTAMLNPYVQQVRDAAAQQAKVLRGLLPSVGAKYRPVLQAYIGSQEASAGSDAASQALAALTGGVGIPMSTYQQSPGAGGGDAVDQFFNQQLNPQP